ncbi:chaplin [Streptomyces catenulae]|uniref:Chaplin n=1 Tax=Streptomyces catenulae TaxID=66875 RepID=A0ABV2YYK2_9ACTN|nr:chaplin [Streptomyces catenulae]
MKRIVTSAALATASCALVIGGAGISSATDGGHESGHGGATAVGAATHSPGVLSGDNIQIPVDIPVNVCGNSIGLVSLLNPAFGNACANK